MATSPFGLENDDFKIAIICALPREADMVLPIFDKKWANRDMKKWKKGPGDPNAYNFGVIGTHNVVLATAPGMGEVASAGVSNGIRSSFRHIEVAFLVGICGASPTHPEDPKVQIKLGDCILSTTVVQYDFGRQYADKFEIKMGVDDVLGRANPTIRSLISQQKVKANRRELTERLVHHLGELQQKNPEAKYPAAQTEGPNQKNNPQIHIGRYGSANIVLKSESHRQKLFLKHEILAFEMEGAGIWDNLPTIIVKSVCDYADSGKNKDWQNYAAATAAAGLKAILEQWSTSDSTKSSPRVAINVPNYAVARFVSRLDIQRELDSWLLGNTQEKIVLRGMGGAGKSQLALACCRKALESEEIRTVLWLDASSTISIEQSLKLAISELDESQVVSLDAQENLAAITKAIQQRRGPWLVVFDNFDKPGDFQQNLITNYIPKAEDGKILFTSRDAASERLGRTIRVSGMSEDESLELLLKQSARNSEERTSGLQIAFELGYLALALDQAAAYIRARNLPLKDFMTHFKRRKKIILQEIPQHWEYRRKNPDTEQDILLSAFTTWELSFEQISGSSEIKQNKEHFLTLCAFFDPISISKDYFEYYCQNTKRSWISIFKDETIWDSCLFDDVVAECSKLSLLQNERDHSGQASLTLHPLIRDWLKLRKNLEQQEIAEEFTDLLVSYRNVIDFDTLELTARQKLLSNITLCIQEDERFRGSRMNSMAYPSYQAAVFSEICHSSGLYNKAEELYKQALASDQKQLGAKHPDTLETMANLANVYSDKGRYDDAEELHNQVLASRKEQLGAKHPDTLWTMASLAIVYFDKGRYDDAEELLNQVLAGNQEQLGAKHPDTLRTMANLANVYANKGRYDDAEELYKQVLAGRKEQLGARHPDTLEIMANLAIVYSDKGRYGDAEELHNQVLAGNQEQLGAKHPSTLRTMGNLANVYANKGRYDDAEELYNQVLAGNQEQLGAKHPDTLRAMHNLAILYQTLSNYSEAKTLFTQVLAGREERLGIDHPDTKAARKKLASLSMEKEISTIAQVVEEPASVLGHNKRKTQQVEDTTSERHNKRRHRGSEF